MFKKLLKLDTIAILTLPLIAFIYRVRGIMQTHPFWVDEFSSAHQAKILTSSFTSGEFTRQLIESNNRVTHVIIAFFFFCFGVSEPVAKLPFVIIGSFVPLYIYLLAKNISNYRVAWGAGLLSLFSYFFITWSDQARGYVLLQLIVLASLHLYLQVTSSKTRLIPQSIALGICLVLGVFVHYLYILLILSFVIHLLIFHKDKVVAILLSKLGWILLILGFVILYKLHVVQAITDTFSRGFFRANNLWYYHSFVWREYMLFAFLSVVGFVHMFFKKKSSTSLLLIYVFIHSIFVFYFWQPYSSRYLLTIFPLLFIASTYAIDLLAQSISKQYTFVVGITLVLIIVSGGHKFVKKPQIFYSVNHDFREIALINYPDVYNIIKEKGHLSENKTAVIDTWHDRAYWYLGEGDFYYLFKWIHEPGLVNGIPKYTEYRVNKLGEKYLPNEKNLRFIGELKDLKLAMSKYPKGFIFIDDATLPKEVISYVVKNFKKEIYLDHYALDDNPYSIWPATLYSWGFEKQ